MKKYQYASHSGELIFGCCGEGYPPIDSIDTFRQTSKVVLATTDNIIWQPSQCITEVMCGEKQTYWTIYGWGGRMRLNNVIGWMEMPKIES